MFCRGNVYLQAPATQINRRNPASMFDPMHTKVCTHCQGCRLSTTAKPLVLVTSAEIESNKAVSVAVERQEY